MATLLGRLEGESSLRSEGGLILLTTAARDAPAPPEASPLAEAREREGEYAIVQGELSREVLYRARIVEGVPPLLSDVLDELLDEGVLRAGDLRARVEASLNRLAGEAPAPVEEDARGPVCALVVGHRPGAKGAGNSRLNVFEYDFNDDLAGSIQAEVDKAEVLIVHRDDAADGYRRLPAKINALNPDFIVSLHCNSFADPGVQGSETLYYHTSEAGQEMARILQRHFVQALQFNDRGVKGRRESDRGGLLLRHTRAPCVIAEPFFISHDEGLQKVLDDPVPLISAYASAIDEIAERFA